MTPRCQCGRPSPDAFLCRDCADKLRRVLDDLPGDLADLQRAATRQTRGPLGLGSEERFGERRDTRSPWEPVGPPVDGALGDAGWVYAPGASDLLWTAGNTLTTWVRHLCESRGIGVPERGESLPAWLSGRIEAIRQDDAAAQIYDELTWLAGAINSEILGPPPPDEFFGLCDAPDVRVEITDAGLRPVPGTCGTKLWGPRDAQRVKCPVCGQDYTRAERHASMLHEMRDRLGSVSAVAAVLTTLGRPVTIKQIDGWLYRGLISPRGNSVESGRIVRMVLVGDILERLDELARRAATRRARIAA